jgi:aminoglycoside phosphotransferase (APT) family kinase protein
VTELNAGGNGKQVVLKAYTRKAYQRGKHNAAAFASHGPLRLARLLGFSDERRLLAFEWLPGATLLEHLAAPEIDREVLGETGAALATLHAQQPDGLAAWSRQDEVAAVAAVAAEIGFVWPPLAHRAEHLAHRIGAAIADAPPLHVPLHGDFSAAQVLVTPPPHARAGGRVAIIDLDWSCRGDPADDLGNLIAQAERQVLIGAHSAAWRESFIATLLDGYRRSTARPLPDRVALYTALNLFRRARHPFRTREPDWPQRTEALLEQAEALTQ